MKDGFEFVDLRKSGRYDIAFRTGIGRRDTQQDTGYTAACDDEVLAVVCDGMGGMRGGELASEAAVERFLEEYEKNGQGGGSAWLEEAIELVDDRVYSLKTPDGSRLGAGTTLVAAHVINDSVSWVSAGDSRLYIIRAGQLVQITTDHNYFFQLDGMLESGAIDSERYQIEVQDGEALISYAGMGGLQWKDISRTPLQLAAGDTLLICSDGLYRSVSDEKILAAVCASQTMEDAAICLEHELCAAAQPEQDNYTYILIHLNRGERL